jgi:hypothetical protein
MGKYANAQVSQSTNEPISKLSHGFDTTPSAAPESQPAGLSIISLILLILPQCSAQKNSREFQRIVVR